MLLGLWCRYEGPGCTIDIDECVRGTAGCNPNAVCVNKPGGARHMCVLCFQRGAAAACIGSQCWLGGGCGCCYRL